MLPCLVSILNSDWLEDLGRDGLTCCKRSWAPLCAALPVSVVLALWSWGVKALPKLAPLVVGMAPPSYMSRVFGRWSILGSADAKISHNF